MTDPLERWATAVSMAEESCLMLDAAGIIVAASGPCARLLCLGQPFELVGRHVLDREVLFLIDFTAAGNELGESEREQIPPLLALTSGRLARGLLRVRNAESSRTLDAIASPLRRHDEVVGSLTFFAIV
ncbi:hypothetical protein [Allorhizocola rhizosphaerae]|uniref:hypothetical protein n=1 Tax=Allorhizocola rhizosphaerae TaxID=1872709 RepID=UPI001FE6C1D5|nr:hypothetical protein [Allorhizocola rhizosphaerae]